MKKLIFETAIGISFFSIIFGLIYLGVVIKQEFFADYSFNALNLLYGMISIGGILCCTGIGRLLTEALNRKNNEEF